MNLKRQLLMVSVLTLILPWAGCQFIQETESALREGQQQMLSGLALAIADSLSQFPDELLTGNKLTPQGANQLYGQPLEAAPLIDGYSDDWTTPPDSAATLRGTDGAISYLIGTHSRHLYLYIDVRDDSLIYARNHDTGNQVFADEVSVVSVDDFDEKTVLHFRAEAPGRIVATREVGTTVFTETRVAAEWLETPGGYRVEARIPRSLAGSKLGLVVTNTTDPREPGVDSASWSGSVPGPFVTISPLLQSVANGYIQPGLRLIITDLQGWRLALAGSTSGSSGNDNTAETGDGWLGLVYKLLLEPGDEALLAGPDPSGREQSSYVAQALQGKTGYKWFRSPDTGRAVVSVAQPVWSGNVQTGAIILQQGTDAILSLTNKVLTRLFTLTLTATVVVALVLLGYASWLSARIRRLSSAAERALDEKQVKAALPSALAGDEIGDLSRSFSSVLRQLGNYNQYLRSLASKLSHELRTPLTIVRSSLENLEHETLSNDARAYTGRAKEGVDRLGTILNAMSEASRTEELMGNVEPELFELGPVLQSTVAAYADAWPGRQFVFTNHAAGKQVMGSPELLIQMLDKLADNAVDFSAEGDQISLSLDADDSELVLQINNPGQPLPEEMRTQMFQSMVSVRKGDDGKHLGLGLHVARLIAEGHNGTISAVDRPVGVTFEIRLPAANAA